MTTSRRGTDRTHFTAAMAGWLFTDLLLALFIMGWGTAATVPAATPSPILSAGASPSPNPSSSPAPTTESPRPVGLSTEPTRVLLTLTTDSSGQPTSPETTRSALQTALETVPGGSTEAGMVLVWGYANEVNAGMTLAQAVAQELPTARPDIFGDATFRTLWKGSRSVGEVELEIYYLTR